MPPAAAQHPQASRPNKRPAEGDNPGESTVATTNTAAAAAVAAAVANPKVKLPRIEPDFSSVVKTKLQSYSRTGQACDRCKVRKIRCDALPEGCSHCLNQNQPCLVTDRVTGRTERRGYLQQLEREKSDMLNRIRELEKLLDTSGVEVKPWSESSENATPAPNSMGNIAQDMPLKDDWQQVGSLWVKNHQPKHASVGAATRYPLLDSKTNTTYLGVSSDSAPLSSIKGTSLSILGATIDLASFEAPDTDEPPPGTPIGSPLYNKSVMAFLQSTLNVNPVLESVDLPPKHDAFTYAEWYFRMLNPYLPILHKPSFFALLTRIYDDHSYKASVPELVLVHMVFATIYFHYGIRNRDDPEKFTKLNDFSNKHYHWCLNKFFDLTISQTVTAVQALAMIVAHTRNFPKPGTSSMVAHYAFNKAIELNFHRAVKHPGGGTTLELEVRKRAWWAILTIMVCLNGRLGRPMPISLEEFDVEFPIAIPDEYLDETGISDPSKIGQCDFHVGLMGIKVTPLYMEMYSHIYGVRRDPKKYVAVVRELEEGMRRLYEEMPEELQLEKCKAQTQVFALYAQSFSLEFSLCLRHPSVCTTDDDKFIAENTRVCEDAAKKLLKIVGMLVKMKSLDTTWYQLSVYLAAVFSMLVAQWERRFEITPFEIVTLRDEMSQWLVVIAEIGRLLGAGHRLTNEVGAVIERTLSWIEHDMNHKTATPSTTQPIKQQSPSPFPQSKQHSTEVSESVNAGNPNEQRTNTMTNGNGFYGNQVANPTPYPNMGFDQSGDTHQNGNSTAGFDPAAASVAQYMQFANAGNGTPTSSTPSAVQGATAADNSTSNPLIAFASQATQHVSGQAGEDWRPQVQAHAHAQAQAHAQLIAQAQSAAAGNAWHHWTAAIAANQNNQDRYSASALLNLGSSRDIIPVHVDHPDHGHGQDAVGMPLGVAATHAGQWPLLLFPDGSTVGAGVGASPVVSGP